MPAPCNEQQQLAVAAAAVAARIPSAVGASRIFAVHRPITFNFGLALIPPPLRALVVRALL